MTTLKTQFWTLMKLALAGGVICAIGFVVVAQDASPDSTPGEVRSAQADIADLASGRDGTEFSRAMLALGFKPRTYDLNGNVMHFASGYVEDKTPTEAMNIVQEEMVQYGVNSRNWLKEAPLARSVANQEMADRLREQPEAIDRHQEQAEAMLDGELVVMRHERDYISVGSVDPRKGMDEVWSDYAAAGGEKPMRDQLGAYRFVDATAEPELNRTLMTAVWTQKEFDSAKLENRAFKQQPADPNVPACVGCERSFRMQSLDSDEHFNHNLWTTRDQSLDRTYEFYSRAMAARGWRESGVQAKLNRLAVHLPEVAALPGRTMNFEKDGKQLTMTLLPSVDGGTAVFSSEEYEGAQLLMDE